MCKQLQHKKMPGPKMGARPADFDETVVRKAPTFQKWLKLAPGEKIRYACRDFIKGHGDDEERLMRRIMIARRNNLRDHEMLKRAREADPVRVKKEDGHGHGHGHATVLVTAAGDAVVGNVNTATTMEVPSCATVTIPTTLHSKKRRVGMPILANSDDIDMPAVEATRSYKAWKALPDGKEFTYNQTYTKGKDGHDFLLRKNIWRRMRYRRENKKMVERMKAANNHSPTAADPPTNMAFSTSMTTTTATVQDGTPMPPETLPLQETTTSTLPTQTHATVNPTSVLQGVPDVSLSHDISIPQGNDLVPPLPVDPLPPTRVAPPLSVPNPVSAPPTDVMQTNQIPTHTIMPTTNTTQTAAAAAPPPPNTTTHHVHMDHTLQIDGSALDAAARLAAATSSTSDAQTMEKTLAAAVAAAAAAEHGSHEEAAACAAAAAVVEEGGGIGVGSGFDPLDKTTAVAAAAALAVVDAQQTQPLGMQPQPQHQHQHQHQAQQEQDVQLQLQPQPQPQHQLQQLPPPQQPNGLMEADSKSEFTAVV